jgi:hypothetical protein
VERIFERESMSSQFTLYVRSVKSAKRNVEAGGYKQAVTGGVPTREGVMQGAKTYSYYDSETVVEYDFALPEDQQRMVKDVTELSSQHGFVLRVVDLTKESAFSNWRFRHLKKIKTLPALVTDSGEIIEGVMTKEQIEALLSKESRLST